MNKSAVFFLRRERPFGVHLKASLLACFLAGFFACFLDVRGTGVPPTVVEVSELFERAN
jgi:hypothetical protein